MKNLIHEIHRRSLWQVLGIYLAGSWVALQVVEQLTEAAGLPDWVRPFCLALLVIGFPVVMATAFVQEGMGARPAEPESDRASGPVPETGETVVDSPPESPAPRPSGGHHRLFTWRNAILGGVGAFALLGLLAAGWLGSRALGIGPAASLVAQGVLEERDLIVLADFESSDDEGSLGDALTEALRIELGNSTVLDVVDGAGITGALRRMQRDPEQGLSRDVALDLAVREGYKAVIAGEVRQLAAGYQLSADILQASDGTSLAGFRETARDADGLIDAIDALSRDIREKAGESIRAVRQDEPLDEVSTASLDALQRYSEGVRAFDADDFQRAQALLEEAVAIDSGFAMAHRKLGAVYQNLRQDQALVDAMSAAYRHRERLTRSERLHVEGTYHLFVTGDRSAAIGAFEQLLDLDPGDHGAANNLAVALGGADPERAAELYRVGIESGSPAAIHYTNIVNPLVTLGRYEEALELLEEGAARFPDVAPIEVAMVRVYAARDERAEARAITASVAEGFRGTYAADVLGPWWDLTFDALEGKLERTASAATAIVESRDDLSPRDLIQVALTPAYARLYSADDPEGAIRLAEDVLTRFPLDSFEPADRQTLGFADLFARAGDGARARSLVEKWNEDRIAGDPSPDGLVTATALADLADGRDDDAIAALERLDGSAPDRCLGCVAFDLALAYDRTGDRDAAIERYEEFLALTHPFKLFTGYFARPHSLRRLGELYEDRAGSDGADASADLQRAAGHFGSFVELWADADEELQPRVRAAQARLEEILREIG
jgi:tetratricopeptide (TPR) repeat protein